MRFMMIVKTTENSGPPPKELMEAIGKLSEEATKAGTMLGSGGLAPPPQERARPGFQRPAHRHSTGLSLRPRRLSAGYAQFELKSKEEAVEGAVRFMELHKRTGLAGKARPKFARCSGRTISPNAR